MDVVVDQIHKNLCSLPRKGVDLEVVNPTLRTCEDSCGLVVSVTIVDEDMVIYNNLPRLKGKVMRQSSRKGKLVDTVTSCNCKYD